MLKSRYMWAALRIVPIHTNCLNSGSDRGTKFIRAEITFSFNDHRTQFFFKKKEKGKKRNCKRLVFLLLRKCKCSKKNSQIDCGYPMTYVGDEMGLEEETTKTKLWCCYGEKIWCSSNTTQASLLFNYCYMCVCFGNEIRFFSQTAE